MTESSAWSSAPAQVAERLRVDPERGLAPDEVAARLRAHGPNALRAFRPPSALRILLNQFASPIVGLLALASVLAFAFGEWLEGAAVVAVLAINSLIGFLTEYRAVHSMEALRGLGTVSARVRRDGHEVEIAATELVPGDVVLLEAGDMVTADLRLLEDSKLEVDESTLTGESVPVSKACAPVPDAAPLAERASMLFKGTAVTRGTAVSLVVATGMDTELGRIAELVQTAQKESTPLEKRLAALGKWLIWATVAIAALTAGIGISAGKPPLLMIEMGIALAVAAIPEGLPIVATMTLARGMWRMARRHALVNRLSAVETLGATSVIFTDKTGTLTENRMTVRRIALADRIVELDSPEDLDAGLAPDLRAALEAGLLCNNAQLGPGDAPGACAWFSPRAPL